jgi:hypothetical protein
MVTIATIFSAERTLMAYQLWETYGARPLHRAFAGVGIGLLLYGSFHDPSQRHWHNESTVYVAPIVHQDMTSSGAVYMPQQGLPS